MGLFQGLGAGPGARKGSCDRLDDGVKEHSPLNCWLTTALTNVPQKAPPDSLAVTLDRIKVVLIEISLSDC